MEKCPDGITRKCCYDEAERQFKPKNNIVTTSDACAICVALREKITHWKHQFDLEVSGRKMAEAELEKRPEVVRCGECKKKDLGFTCPLACANAVIEAKTKTKNFILFDDNDFCSAGQRGESEEGK